jgi:hypothetical protein
MKLLRAALVNVPLVLTARGLDIPVPYFKVA